MFGKPEWFRDKKIGWGLIPVSWQGWTYTAAWGAAITGPFVALMSQSNATMTYRLGSALIWTAFMLSGLVWDVWQIKRARLAAQTPPKKEPVLYIGDDDARSVSTKNLDLQLRR